MSRCPTRCPTREVSCEVKCLRPAARRGGFSLLEMVFCVSVLAVLGGITITLLAKAARQQNATRDALFLESSLVRLAMRFRQDAHAAVQAVVLGEQLLLIDQQRTRVRFRPTADGIERTELPASGKERTDLFVLPLEARITFPLGDGSGDGSDSSGDGSNGDLSAAIEPSTGSVTPAAAPGGDFPAAIVSPPASEVGPGPPAAPAGGRIIKAGRFVQLQIDIPAAGVAQAVTRESRVPQGVESKAADKEVATEASADDVVEPVLVEPVLVEPVEYRPYATIIAELGRDHRYLKTADIIRDGE